MSDILVVEGIITDDETTIRLIRSVDITETVFSFVYVRRCEGLRGIRRRDDMSGYNIRRNLCVTTCVITGYIF